MSPDGERENGDGTHWYEAPPPARCHSCDAIAGRVEQTIGGDVKPPRSQALRFHAVKHVREKAGG